MKKLNSIFVFVLFLSLIILPTTILAQSPKDYPPSGGVCGPIMQPGTGDQGSYTLKDFFIVIENLYRFFALCITTPLATLMLIIGAIVLLASSGNPNLQAMGKKMLWAAIIGLILALGSWLIITTILTLLGANVK